MKPEISVIMPVYGVERYVARAVESVLAQTFRDFELIVVDDGSPDRSAEIVGEYAAADGRIRLIRQANAGAPAARNRAMELARGKYIYFMDSDDWAEPDMLKDMRALAEEYDLQEVVAGFYIDTYYDADRYVSTCVSQPDRVYATQREFRENAYRLFDCNLLYTPWNKLFRADYLREKGVVFPDTFWDDFPFNLSALRDVERIGVISRMYYHFIRARSESETARYREAMFEKREEEHAWMLDLYRYWNVDGAENMEMIYRRYIERVVGCVENLASPECGLSMARKLQRTREMLCTPNVSVALRKARPRSVMMKLILIPVRMRCASLTYLECAFMNRVRRSNVRVFAILKASR